MSTLTSLDKYGSSFQTKVISALLTDKNFLINIHDVLDIEYFNSQSHKWIIKEILKYYHQYHCNITIDILKIELKKIDNEVLQISIKEQLKESYRSSSEDLEYVEQEFSNFCKNQQLKRALLNSVDLLNEGDYDSIRNLIDNALKSGLDKNVGLEYEKDIEARYRDEDRSPIPFPWKVFNDHTQGGYGKGDLVLIFGNPGGGKSWACIDMAVEAAKLGKNVVYYSLELGEGYVGKRMDAYLTGIDVDKITKHRKEVEDAIEALPGKIVVKEYSPKRASLNTIEKHLHQLKYQFDFKPDVIFIDYLDLLKNRQTRKDRLEESEDIFIEAKGLAKTLQIPVISPSQVNRAGAKDDIIEGDKIAGSYQKIMLGDITISLSRKRRDKVEGTGRWHVMKNRFGADGMSYFSTINTKNGHIVIEEDQLDDDFESDSSQYNKQKAYGDIDKDDKQFLKEKFFQLNQ